MVNVATQTDKEACFDLEVCVKKTENRIAYHIQGFFHAAYHMPQTTGHMQHVYAICHV